MKKSLTTIVAAVVLFAAVATLPACKKKEKEGTYLLEYTVAFKAPAETFNTEFSMVDTMLTSKLSSAMSSAGVSLDNVKSVKLNQCKLSLAPAEVAAGKTFDPYMYANAHLRTASKPESQFAFIDEEKIGSGKTEITFDSQHAEWVDYLKQNEIGVRVKAYNTVDVEATDYTLYVSFDVVYAEK